MKLIKEAVVAASICDSNVKLGVKGTFDLVQDYLTEMMGDLGIDGVSLRERYGCVWIFTRNRVEIDRELTWKERYTAESFISSAKGAKMTVDTVLKDENGNTCVYSRIEMCALDLATQKIRRIRDVGITSDTHVEAPEREIAFSRLKHEGLEEIERLIVKSGDIMNTYTVKELRENRVKAIEVRYAGQTHEGDELSIRKAVQDGKELFDVCLGDMVAVECEIERS